VTPLLRFGETNVSAKRWATVTGRRAAPDRNRHRPTAGVPRPYASRRVIKAT
jgi:hypothetical protein